MSAHAAVPELERHCGSWIVTTSRGQVVELFERADAEKCAARSWKIETALQYLVRFNASVKAA